MALITAADISRAQTAFAPLLTTPCTVTRQGTPVSDGYGGRTSNPVTVYTGMCALAPQSGGQIGQTSGALVSQDLWAVSLPVSAGVQPGDTLSLTDGSQRVFTVQGWRSGLADPVLLVVSAVELRQV